MNAAKEFLNGANKAGWNVRISGGVVKISQNFQAGNVAQFADLDMSYYGLLEQVPVVKGDSSIWGSDGGGMGGMIALQNGLFVANISGVKKMFLKQLEKELNGNLWKGLLISQSVADLMAQ